MTLYLVASRVRASVSRRSLDSDLRRSDRGLLKSLRLEACSGSHRGRGIAIDGRGSGSCCVTIHGLLAFSADVTSLTAPVASLTRCVRGGAVGSGAVARDVAELAARVALHGLSLAIAREVVRTSALVASRLAVSRNAREATSESAPRWATGTTTRGRASGSACWSSTRSRAVALIIM